MSDEFRKKLERDATLYLRAREHGWSSMRSEDGSISWYGRWSNQLSTLVVKIPFYDDSGDLLEKALDDDEQAYREWRAAKWEAA